MLVKLKIETEETSATLRADMAARQGSELLAVSAAGPDSACKALASLLQADTPTEFRFLGLPYEVDFPQYGLRQADSGYRTARTRLIGPTFHVLAIARIDGLLRNGEDETLWQELRSERFTTPILRGWIPWLKERLTEEDLLSAVKCFGDVDFWRLDATTDDIDFLCCEGLKDGSITI